MADTDLASIQQARDLLARAKKAQQALAEFSQEEVDRVVQAMCEAGYAKAEELARMAVEETQMGTVDGKRQKNELCTRLLWDAIRPMRTVGIISKDETKRLLEIAEPMGVIAAIVPTTNPTSTALFKCIVAVKSRNGIVISPHPRAVRCTSAAVETVHRAAVKAGAPEGICASMTVCTMEGTQELMRHDDTSVILATGGSGLVKAAYSSGKPAYGVGPGNVPAFIEKSADIPRAVKCIIESQSFDWGTVCASEQSVIVEAPIRDAVIAAFKAAGAHFASPEEKKKLEATVVKGDLMSPETVGLSPEAIAKKCGFAVAPGTRLLIVELKAVGAQEPLSMEKLEPVIGFYTETDWHAACKRCMEILHFGGMGHSCVVHSRDEKVVLEFALKKPAYRFLVNTPATQGAVGYTTNLIPSMTLGCGTAGGNITSDNISPLNLLNIKRVAFDKNDPFAAKFMASLPSAPGPVALGAPAGAGGSSPVSREELLAILGGT
ncbi:MAG: aldehyde dehydrogenase family protein [Planctomycetes bacterium]|nr:aldehyde dehydrogenase family protein [Planctomycetota bacterium]